MKLGRVTPSRFPYKDRPRAAPGVAPSPGNVLRAREVIIVGPNGRILLYNPNVAAGKLADSMAAVGGTDGPPGNAYLAGTTSYLNVPTIPAAFYAANLNGAALNFYTALTEAGPWSTLANVGVTFASSAPGAPPGGMLELGSSVGTIYPANREAMLFPSGDTTGATDSTALGQLLAMPVPVKLAPGNVGTYYLSGPLALPDQSCLFCPDPTWGIPTGNYGAGGLPLQGAIIRAGSSFAGGALATMGGVGTVQHGGQRLYGITFSGTGAPAGTAGIISTGYVGGVKMRDVVVWGMPGKGLLATNDGTPSHIPDFWQADGCKFSGNGDNGVETHGLSDSWFVNSESTGNGVDGWNITGGADTRWIACRGSSNTRHGLNLDPTVAGNILTFIGLETKLNGGFGAVFQAGQNASYKFTDWISAGNTSGQYQYAGSSSDVYTDGGNVTVWVPIAYVGASGWGNFGGTGPNAQYALHGTTFELIADMSAGNTAAGTGVFDLPASQLPAHTQEIPIYDITNRSIIAFFNVGVLGTLSFFNGTGAVSLGDECFVHAYISTSA